MAERTPKARDQSDRSQSDLVAQNEGLPDGFRKFFQSVEPW
jgi:hypothetical protein